MGKINKNDPRGPYTAIRWFCPDGTTLPADGRCEEAGGIEHAVQKPVVVQLAETEGLHWGQIIAGTQSEAFLDAENHFSRLNQYRLERYLQRVDDGWIIRKARCYRGAVQFDDESRWGADFMKAQWADDHLVDSQFLLLRQAVRDIPHFADDDRWKAILARSQAISASLSAFYPLRINLHGQPDPADIIALKGFLKAQQQLAQEMHKEIQITRPLIRAKCTASELAMSTMPIAIFYLRISAFQAGWTFTALARSRSRTLSTSWWGDLTGLFLRS